MYVAHHMTIFQQMKNCKNDGYDWIDSGIHIRYFLAGIDEPSLKTAVQIYKFQDSYIINFILAPLISQWWCKILLLQNEYMLWLLPLRSKASSSRIGIPQTVVSLLQSIQEVSTRWTPQRRKNGSGKTTRKPRLMRTTFWQPRKDGNNLPPSRQGTWHMLSSSTTARSIVLVPRTKRWWQPLSHQ